MNFGSPHKIAAKNSTICTGSGHCVAQSTCFNSSVCPRCTAFALTRAKRTAYYTSDSCRPTRSQCSTDACRPKNPLCWTARLRWHGTWPMPCTRPHHNCRRHHKLHGKHSVRLRWRHVDSHRCTRIDSVRCKCH